MQNRGEVQHGETCRSRTRTTSIRERQHEPHLHECPRRECVGRARRAGGATWSVRTLSPAAGCVHAPGLETLHPRAVCGGSVISGCLPPQALARVSPTHAHLAVLLLPVCRCHAHGMALSLPPLVLCATYAGSRGPRCCSCRGPCAYDFTRMAASMSGRMALGEVVGSYLPSLREGC